MLFYTRRHFDVAGGGVAVTAVSAATACFALTPASCSSPQTCDLISMNSSLSSSYDPKESASTCPL